MVFSDVGSQGRAVTVPAVPLEVHQPGGTGSPAQAVVGAQGGLSGGSNP